MSVLPATQTFSRPVVHNNNATDYSTHSNHDVRSAADSSSSISGRRP